MRRYGYLLLAGLFFLSDCNTPEAPSDAAKAAAQQPKDNYIVLLDLGDRILLNPRQQIPKDIDIIRSVYSIFKSKLAIKDPAGKYYGVTDKLKLLGAPNWFYTSVDLSAEQPDKRAVVPDKMGDAFNALVPEIYKGVIINTDEHSGSDIWRYFNEHLSDDLDKNGQNTLFIVTDGYMDVKKPEDHPAQKNRYASCTQIINALKDSANWETKFVNDDYGLLPISKKFANLRVIVLEVNPKAGWADEYSLLTKIWDKWFAEMGISNYSFIKNDSSPVAKAMLGKLMNVQLDTAAGAGQWAQTATTPDSLVTTNLATQTTSIDSLKKNSVVTHEQASKIENTAVKEVLPAAPAPKENIGAAATTTAPAQGFAVKTPPVPKKKETSTPEVVPPDESDARILNTKTTGKAAKKTGAKNDDDILQDEGAANGFNTGIKKDSAKKKNN